MVAYINKQGGTHSAEMCAVLWKITTWCHHYHITLKARHIPGCLNVMANLLSRSNQVQSTEWSLYPGMPWFWNLVQLSTEIPLQLPVSTTLFHNYVFHSNPQHLNLHAWCLGVDNSKNKASLWRWQRELLPLRGQNISDFFMYLYQDLNRRPSTIDGDRTAIVDILGPMGHHITQNSDLHRLLSSFHRDRPKSSRNLPKWNLSVVLNELTKVPFEPMKDTDLKHLTLKTAFLLALASGKRCSEIHAWVANKVFKLGQWENVALFPSSDFIANNQLAREGSQSVSPMTIPTLTAIVDRQFKEDRTLCSVQALRYYLDRTKDLRGSRSLLFISFKKGHTSDIRPATLSSWLKQTILLCYKQADQQALDLVHVKVHDIRAFAASKAFYSGVSVDQIMQACHWKGSQHIYKFLPKRPYLVRQRQQYVSGTSGGGTTSPRSFPSDKVSSERKEGEGGTSATTKSSGV